MSAFRAAFGRAPEACGVAPGRVNLLGEHTDYNDGFVLPTTIPQTTTVELAASASGRHEFRSESFTESVSFAAGEEPPEGFGRYLFGCIQVLRERGIEIPPLCLLVRSEVPIGSGLSSSAALEIAMLRALRVRFALGLDDVELARLAQEAEIRFAGVRCGIMDQMAASLGRTGQMLFLDTRTLERRLLPMPAGAAVIVLDSGVPRSLAASAYNERRSECEAAARVLGVRALRDVTDPAALRRLAPPLDRRARHVVTENARVLQAVCGADARAFGTLMNASHASLRDDFEVSTPELDALVALLQRDRDAFGARLTGAGFGGACVALVREAAVQRVRAEVLAAYRELGGRGSVLV